MKVSCPACDSKYTIADEKVAGRKVKVRCKSCGGQILINGTIPPAAPDPGDDDEATRVFTGAERRAFDEQHADAAAAPPKSAAKSAPVRITSARDDGIIWSVNVSETDERSLKTREVVDGYLSGEFVGETYVWCEGMTDWTGIPDVPELAAAIDAARQQASKAAPAAKQRMLPSLAKGGRPTEASAPPLEHVAATRKTASRVAGAKRPESAHDLFAAANTAGSSLDVVVSEEEDDDAQKRTGARNENSVLFSLDALKAGITAAPQQQQQPKGAPGRKAPATPRRKLEDLMGDASAPMASGAIANPLLLSANQALLTAPAPPPPKPKPEPVVVQAAGPVSAAAISYAREKEKTKRLLISVIAAIVGIGAIAGIALAMTKGKPEPAPVASTKAVAVATVAAATPEPVKTPEPVAAPEKTTESAARSAAPGSAQKPSGGTQVGSKTGAGAVAKTEIKKDPKKEEPAGPPVPVSTGTNNFNKEATSQALAVAASQTSICKKPDGPTGTGKVQVTFAPSGRATTANIVSGPFGGTPVGSCVSGVFKRARVPAFSGDPVTVSKSFSITR